VLLIDIVEETNHEHFFFVRHGHTRPLRVFVGPTELLEDRGKHTHNGTHVLRERERKKQRKKKEERERERERERGKEEREEREGKERERGKRPQQQ